MKSIMKYKAILLVLFPLIMGFLIEKLLVTHITNKNQLYLGLGNLLLAIWIYGGGIIFWFYVGWVFGKFKTSIVNRFILGNIAWVICLSLYIWKPVISQYYSLGFVLVSG